MPAKCVHKGARPCPAVGVRISRFAGLSAKHLRLAYEDDGLDQVPVLAARAMPFSMPANTS